MAYELGLDCISLEAGQDLSAKQYFFVVQAANDGQVDPAGDGVLVTGVLQNNPGGAGQAASIAINGISKVSVGAAVTRGDVVTSDTNGEAVTIASGKYPAGRALEGATAAHQIIAVELMITATVRP